MSPHLDDDPAEREKWTTMVATSVNKGLFTPPALTNTMQIRAMPAAPIGERLPPIRRAASCTS